MSEARNLESLWSTTLSRKCKETCIDQGLFFCSDNERATKGTCCTNPTTCSQSSNSLCSFDSNALGLAYYTCPRQVSVCGSKEVVAVTGESDKSTALELYSDFNQGQFVNGEVCRYRLVYPYQARDYDEIRV